MSHLFWLEEHLIRIQHLFSNGIALGMSPDPGVRAQAR